MTVPCLRAAFNYHLIISIPAVHLELLAVSKTTVSFCLRPVSAAARHISKVSRSAEDCRRTTGCAGGGLEERQVGGKPLKPHSKEAGSNNSSIGSGDLVLRAYAPDGESAKESAPARRPGRAAGMAVAVRPVEMRLWVRLETLAGGCGLSVKPSPRKPF